MTIRYFRCDNGHDFEATFPWMNSKWDCPVCVEKLVRDERAKREEEALLFMEGDRFSLDEFEDLI